MNDQWKDSPFKNFKVIPRGNAFILKSDIEGLHCAKCKKGRANKKCKRLYCKNCCDNDDSDGKICAAHAKRKGAAYKDN